MVKRNSIVVCCLIASVNLFGIAPLGLFSPYDLNMRNERAHKDGTFQTALFGETSHTVTGFNLDGEVVNSLQTFDDKQNVTAFCVAEPTSVFAAGIGAGAEEDDGLYSVTGNYSATQFVFNATYAFGGGFLARAYVPLYSTSLAGVLWEYAGSKTSFVGATQAELFEAFETESKENFDLDIYGWKKTGVGDVAFLIDYERDFPQRRNILRNVRPLLRFGITFPSGEKQNMSQFGSIPLGADGSVTIPFGGGLRVDLGGYVQLGFNAQFWYIWGNTRMRRIKTSLYQTELLLPIVAEASKQNSLLQNFALHGTVFSKNRCFSLKGFYEYVRKGEDIVTPVGTEYNYTIINDHTLIDGRWRGQKSLDESTSHNFTLKLGYDHHYAETTRKVVPQFYLFYKKSFNGSYANVASTFGASLALDF